MCAHAHTHTQQSTHPHNHSICAALSSARLSAERSVLGSPRGLICRHGRVQGTCPSARSHMGAWLLLE